MNNLARAQQRYREEAILSASPERLVTMLYDRLLLDIDRGEAAQRAGDREKAHAQITHAQAILAELQGSLDRSSWPGAEDLLALYSHVTVQLVQANISGDADKTHACRELIAPLRDAFHGAADNLAATA